MQHIVIELQMSVRIIRVLLRRAQETDQILLYEPSFSHIGIFVAKLVTDILEFQTVSFVFKIVLNRLLNYKI